MEHTHIVTAEDLANYADKNDSVGVIPELIWMLVRESILEITTCRIPYGDSINQPGWDGWIETANGFRQFIPPGRSCWEIGTGKDPQKKATEDFKKRTLEIASSEAKEATYVVVTPRQWSQSAQTKWVNKRKASGWKEIKILDGVVLADWLREFPAIGKWLLKKMGLVRSCSGFSTPAEHWENIKSITHPPLPPELFFWNRTEASLKLFELLRGTIKQISLTTEGENDVEDFVAACLTNSNGANNKVLFVRNPDIWYTLVKLRTAHVLVVHPTMGFTYSDGKLHAAINAGHRIIISTTGPCFAGNITSLKLQHPSASHIERVLSRAGFNEDTATELSKIGAQNLNRLKRHLRGLGEMPPYTRWGDAHLLVHAMLIGKWDSKNVTDRKIVATLTQKSYEEWIDLIRHLTFKTESPLIQYNGCWRMISRREVYTALGPQILLQEVILFRKIAIAILAERNSIYDSLSKNSEHLVAFGDGFEHSNTIREGVAEMLAFLGSGPEALTQCSSYEVESIVQYAVQQLFENADWVVWASLQYQLPLLAEAAPEKFLTAIENALTDGAGSAINILLTKTFSDNISGHDYASGLIVALETLSWNDEYFPRTTLILSELATMIPNPDRWSPYSNPLDSLISVFLTQYSQTYASALQRKDVLKLILQEQPKVGWKLLLSLLLIGHTSHVKCCRKPEWRQFMPKNWPEKIIEADHKNEIRGYADLAFEFAHIDLNKMADLIEKLPSFPSFIRLRIFDYLTSETILCRPEQDRLPLWEALVKLSFKHRNATNKDAHCAMSVEMIIEIERVAFQLAPKNPRFTYRRYFNGHFNFTLFVLEGNSENREKMYNLQRQAVCTIFALQQIGGILEFARDVKEPEAVGLAFGQIDSNVADAIILPYYLGEKDGVPSEFVSGFIAGRFQTGSWQWVNGMIDAKWTAKQKAEFFSKLPFYHETWRRAEKELGQYASAYWEKVEVESYDVNTLGEHCTEAVGRLLQFHQPGKALICLNRLICKEIPFPAILAVQTLKERLLMSKLPRVLEIDIFSRVIGWLQRDPSVDQATLIEIEQAFFPLFSHYGNARPKSLEMRLAMEPIFFCEIISKKYGLANHLNKDCESREIAEASSQKAAELLDLWRIVPGTLLTGGFDKMAFEHWLKTVRSWSIENQCLKIVLYQIGQILPFAPPDPDGLWIHRTIATALNARGAEAIRNGFVCRLLSMGNATQNITGMEGELAVRYYRHANDLEQVQFHWFAAAMRGLAKEYQQIMECSLGYESFRD